MKTKAVVVLLALLASINLSAQMASTINVGGDAEVRVVPDEVVINVGVESRDRVLKAAKTANDAAIRRALDVAARHGVESKDAQTDYISIEPVYRTQDSVGELLGYVVRKSLTVRLRDIAKFEELFTDLIDAGVNVVHGVEFRTTQLRKLRDQARLMAIKAAKEKAQLLAEAAGKSLGATISVGENGGGWYSPYSSWWGRSYGYSAQNVVQNAGGEGPTQNSLAPGQITVTAHVGLTIALQ